MLVSLLGAGVEITSRLTTGFASGAGATVAGTAVAATADVEGEDAPVAPSSPSLLHAASITRLIKTKTIMAVPPRNKLLTAIPPLILENRFAH
jgi:hypothetical protein